MNATMKIVTRSLPCPMTSDEYATKSKELVQWMNAQAQMEDKIKDLKSAYKEPIKQAKEKVDDLRITLNTQTIAKDVKVAQIFNWDTGTTFQRRMDTGEIVPGSMRKINPDEAQTDATEQNPDEPIPAAWLQIEAQSEVEPGPLALPAPVEEAEVVEEGADGLFLDDDDVEENGETEETEYRGE